MGYFSAVITRAGCWEKTRKACKSLAFGSLFISFSRFLPTSRSGYHACLYLNKVIRRLSTLVDHLDVDFVLQHFKLCLFVNKGDGETNW